MLQQLRQGMSCCRAVLLNVVFASLGFSSLLWYTTSVTEVPPTETCYYLESKSTVLYFQTMVTSPLYSMGWPGCQRKGNDIQRRTKTQISLEMVFINWTAFSLFPFPLPGIWSLYTDWHWICKDWGSSKIWKANAWDDSSAWDTSQFILGVLQKLVVLLRTHIPYFKTKII